MNQPQKPPLIPPEVSRQILGQHDNPSLVAVETAMLSTTISGPLPSPDILSGYEKVLAGSADRIIRMAEKEQDYRHLLRLRGQKQQVGITVLGQVFAFVLCLSGIAGGVFLVARDKPITGFSVFFTSLASMLGCSFITEAAKVRRPSHQFPTSIPRIIQVKVLRSSTTLASTSGFQLSSVFDRSYADDSVA